MALNDYLDIETDRLNKKMPPLVNGTISPGFALWFSIISLALSLVLAYFINTYAFLIVLVLDALAIAYDWKLKVLPLLGNIYIGLSMAIPFIFGDFVVSDKLGMIAVALALLGFVAGIAREIVKSAQDVEGDMKARGSRTLPIVIGKGPALAIASILYILFIPLSLSPFALGLAFNPYSVAMIGMEMGHPADRLPAPHRTGGLLRLREEREPGGFRNRIGRDNAGCHLKNRFHHRF